MALWWAGLIGMMGTRINVMTIGRTKLLWTIMLDSLGRWRDSLSCCRPEGRSSFGLFNAVPWTLMLESLGRWRGSLSCCRHEGRSPHWPASAVP
jgi:hypothetical protein